MKIFIHSCHASLEYDHVRTLLRAGHEVIGEFDIGSKQRPKIAGVTDIALPPEVKQRIHHDNGPLPPDMTLEEIGNPDVILVHQTSDYFVRAPAYAALGKPTFAVIFGQGNPECHAQLAAFARKMDNLHIIVYSAKEAKFFEGRLPATRLHMIRFGKYEDEFDPRDWVGDRRECFLPCNDIQNRGDGCGWGFAQKLQSLLGSEIPIVFGGKHTDQIGGLGELTYDDYRDRLQHAAVYFSVGTVPAPYTLSLVEAACSGTPIVAFDNGQGIANEGFGIKIVNSLESAAAAIKEALDGQGRLQGHMISTMLASGQFAGEVKEARWHKILVEAVNA